ncbi:DUF927 domain-containing protein [Falsiruegeria litorea]|uniref:DUF927 domain-containing protein n=1 Tax=Falsiruegeria litorea TaxID=1280831 RepID=UPI001BFE6200|nr:DUF927 domain-containing protein [Falsiruegeria litorea]MBT8167628.1 DUF927 domain-containing protein [Falsiruegeria litorea]
MEDITKRTPDNVPAEPKVLKRYKLDMKTDIEVRDGGVFLVERKVTKDGKAYDEVKMLASSVIDIKGLVDPIDSDDAAALLVHIDGRAYTVTRDSLTTSQDIGRWLAARAAFFNPSHASMLARMFMETRPERIVGYTRNGWAKNGAFVVGDRVLLGSGVAVGATDHKSAGTFEEWEQEVLSRAYQKPMWVFGILVGLSSVLLEPLGVDTGAAFNPYGTSGSGKTDALRAAAGVWGQPSDVLKSFSTTANALENMFEDGNHLGIVLDEMRTASKGLLADFAYLFGNGMGKERMKSNADQVRRRRWLLNCIMSSEKSVEGIFNTMDETQAAGMVTRLIDFDARRWYPIIALEEVTAFEGAVRQYYGTAGPEFVRRIAGMDDLVDRWAALTRELYSGDDAKLLRTARIFAQLKLTAEVMGIEAQVVDDVWSMWSLEVVDVFDDDLQIGRDLLEFIEANLRVSIVELNSAIEDDENPFPQEDGEKDRSYQKRAGWYDTDDNTVYLRVPAIDKIMQGHGKASFYEWLYKRGILHKPAKGDRWPVRVPRLAHRPSALQINLARLQDVVE